MSDAGLGIDDDLDDEEDLPDLDAALLRIAALEWQVEPRPLAILEAVEKGVGGYEGLPPRVELLSDGRWARLIEPIVFTGPDGIAWPVPVGAELNGASIPRLFWTLMGGPFEGIYRDASIVHDHYCIMRSRAWRDTHRMFFEAMRCSGVGAIKAKVMYYAVYRFGPRWPLPGKEALEAVEVAPSEAELTDAEAPSLAADAEAIYVQNLELDEIEALADARNAASEEAMTEAPRTAAEKLDRARRLVVIGGSGRPEDLEAVAREAARLPAFVMKRFEKKKVRIIACRESVTDFEKDLRGVTPRGWEATGKTWDDVPGAYFPTRKRVIIATIAGTSGRVVPTRETLKHGSENLLVHESLHGFDWVGKHKVLKDPRFVNARTGDLPKLGPYEKQDGIPGLEETFAESGARFVANPIGLQQAWPKLHAYWAAGPHGALEAAPLPTETVATESVEAPAAIGTAEFTGDGSIRLDLRAEDEEGAIGHALLTFPPGDPAHEVLRAHLAGDSMEESAEGGVMLFRPVAAR